jgi:endonuclease/exonuclease/phosphatase family metal-dependent hydrolase
VVLCGDFNMLPGSAPYQIITACYRDAQLLRKNGSPLSTFVSPLPFVRIDYIFLSKHFDVENIRVPRNSLTSVASDHLPLLVDVNLKTAVLREAHRE